MTLFWALAALLLVAALAFIVVPLTRTRAAAGEVRRETINVSVYRDQLRELDADLQAGTLTQERYDEAVREIERRLLEDTSTAPKHEAHIPGARRAALVAGIAVPVLAAALYFLVGTPQALTPQQASAEGSESVDRRQFEAMVQSLAARLRANPDDPQGWAMLARSYVLLENFAEAAKAYAAATARNPNDAQLFAEYANALAMAQGRSLAGEPEQLVKKALSLDPNNVRALALAGSAAFDKRDFAAAVAHWERILQLAPPGSELAQAVQGSVNEARALAGGSAKSAGAPIAPAMPAGVAGQRQAAEAAGGAVSGIVQLAPEVASKVAPTDTVFVFARAAEGSRTPVAILKAQAKDLPLEFTLDDRSAIMSGAKLSDQKLVIVGVRISKSGNATAQPGDVQGYSAPVAPGTSNLRIVVSELAK